MPPLQQPHPKKIIKYILLVLLGVLLVAAIILTFQVQRIKAFGGNFYAGRRTGSLSCTCTNNTLIYIQDVVSNTSLALIYDSSTKLYANNNIYGTYLMGSYSSGGQCEQYVGEECEEVKSDGTMDSNPGTGTSF
ncbi:MAG TPA: hypothetical protein VLB02_01810 [Candidatus Paceibacterota bacterium]|nr:hypothetical protein [Candidatus Paceibacterota bacterium]